MNVLKIITNVLEACPKIIFASTCCVYGNHDTYPIGENTFPKPTEIYAHSKLAGEHLILGYAKHFGDGKQTRTLTYVEDIVEGIVAVLGKNVWDEIINITQKKMQF